MSTDDDRLDFDLSAWDAPPPPAGLADVVIGRVGGGDERSDVAVAMPAVEHPREPRRAWLIAAVAAAVAVVGIGVWSLARDTTSVASSGSVVAERARTLSLGSVHATLDAGAEVRWRRNDDVLHVEQRAGTAVWRVDSDDKLVIDAGARAASVVATGANVRVEVSMNAMDTRVIGAGVATAAAVAMVSVVVYEGHVKVTKPGEQTVVVSPGETYRTRDEKKQDAQPDLVGTTAARDVGGRGKRVAILGLEPETPEPALITLAQSISVGLRDTARTQGPYDLAANSARELVDEKLLANCESEAPPCMAAIGANLGVDVLVYGRVTQDEVGYSFDLQLLDVATRRLLQSHLFMYGRDQMTPQQQRARDMYIALVDPPAPTDPPVTGAPPAIPRDELTPAEIKAALAGAQQRLETCRDTAPEGGNIYFSVQSAPDGTISRLKVTGPNPELEACVRSLLRGVTFPKKKRHQSFAHIFTLKPALGSCDAKAFKERGMAYLGKGQHRAAVNAFEVSLQCAPSADVRQLAYLAACNARLVFDATVHYDKLTKAAQQKYLQICLRNGIDPVRGEMMDTVNDVGYIEIDSTPRAKILVDGKDTGLATPIRRGQLSLAPGKHKITFDVAGERYTYPVEIVAGETAKLDKDF